ncbi:hypothetical protein JCM3765_004686 [Sporobolomyces pararoseus]
MASLASVSSHSSTSSSTQSNETKAAQRVVRVMFFALVLDLLAFTMPLPLFPRIIDDFVQQESQSLPSQSTTLSRTLSTVRTLRSYLFSFTSTASIPSATNTHFDLTLLGGLLGSTFSFCQFLISPFLGSLSDKFGRKRILMLSMLGNLLSATLWLGSGSFGIYSISRIVGGLSEGNVQLSIAAISDVTTPATRSKSLALVGIAFSLAFTLGPSLGAYFASKDLFHLALSPIVNVPILGNIKLNSYAVPASITLALLTVETLYLAVYLPETKNWRKLQSGEAKETKVTSRQEVKRTLEERRERLERLEWIHFGFLFFFSGAEFTITFLTNNLFDFSNAQNGRLLGFIGVLSSLLQGGVVRRASSTPQKTFALALSGIRTCQLSLLLLSSLPFLSRKYDSNLSMFVLYLASAGLAFVSATVVNSLNSLASLEADGESPQPESGGAAGDGAEGIEKGKALGKFRSKGQLGRALGPLFATGVYWCISPGVAYAFCAIGTTGVAMQMKRLRKKEEAERNKKDR